MRCLRVFGITAIIVLQSSCISVTVVPFHAEKSSDTNSNQSKQQQREFPFWLWDLEGLETEQWSEKDSI